MTECRPIIYQRVTKNRPSGFRSDVMADNFQSTAHVLYTVSRKKLTWQFGEILTDLQNFFHYFKQYEIYKTNLV